MALRKPVCMVQPERRGWPVMSHTKLLSGAESGSSIAVTAHRHWQDRLRYAMLYNNQADLSSSRTFCNKKGCITPFATNRGVIQGPNQPGTENDTASHPPGRRRQLQLPRKDMNTLQMAANDSKT
ncbi:hypothetical protein E4U43_007894 [Claviceps pusilla]|uniref:Uncharacterized protein n=1 Tax=Claviceps pusilla TaxID=123648 RepID=A0A9P7NBU6_9HYPO|nr:hypothetical protein E4U43_007894 [Claviceps pusilla]